MSAPDRAAIVERLLGFLRQAYPERSEPIRADTRLASELFVDSFGLIETALFVEQDLGVDLLASGVTPGDFDSVETLATAVERALAAGRGAGRG